jgi:hypothetical protein
LAKRIEEQRMATRAQIIRRLETNRRKHRKLCEALADIGPVKRGSIYKTYSGCGSPGCRCHRDPEARHGPYWYWTCKIDGKSRCRKLEGHTLSLYRRYASNYKKLKEALKRIEKVSDEILKCQVELAQLEPPGRGRRSKGK